MPRLVMPALALFGLLLIQPALAQTNDPHKATALADGRVRITSAADLPIHTYTVTSKAVPLAEDNEAVSALAAAVSAAITADLAQYDIADRTTRRDMYRTLANAALFRQDFSAARRYSGIVRGLQDKPADRAVSGLLGMALADALQSPGADFHQTLRANIVYAYRPIPYAWAHEDLQKQKSGMEIMTRDLIITLYANTVAPDSTGRLSQSQVDDLLTEAIYLRYFLLNKADFIAAFSAILASDRPGPKADIWAARDVTLAPAAKLSPVVVGVWDSGVDITLYKSHLVSGQPGIAFDSQARPTTSLLYPMPGGAGAVAAYQADRKGYTDFQAGIDSPEAAAFKTKITSMTSDQADSFDVGLSQLESYQHGTSVAGIALRGNPAARLLVCRMDLSESPSVAQAEHDAAMFRQCVAYFKRRGARVVNMSWNMRLADIDTHLEHDGTVRTPAERRALAKKIFDIGSQGISDAIHSAPGLLFITAAGNDDENILFSGSYPADIKAPNLLGVGAVDGSGEETSFTSFGNVDVYADGVDVPSFVPGGATEKFSGTSVAAPQVTNLAAKMLAERPSLTPTQVRADIIRRADRRTAGDRTILLINPKRTLAALTSKNGSP